MKNLLFIFCLSLISCKESPSQTDGQNHTLSHANTKIDKTFNQNSGEKVHQEGSPNEEDNERLTAAQVNADLQATGMKILFDGNADLNEDRIPDRLIIMDDSSFQNNPHENKSGRQLRLYYGETGNTFLIGIISDNAIPPFESIQMVGKETVLQDFQVGKGFFAFTWYNESYFTYRYRFVYDPGLQTLKLSEMQIEERAERYPQEEIKDLRLTEADFGERPLEFFNAQRFQLFTDPEVRRNLKE